MSDHGKIEERARAMWRHVGDGRPPFARTPGPGQESVWDYPRPPRIAADTREVVVRAGEVEIARTRRALRVLETASPPTFYLPWDDLRHDCLEPGPGSSTCEWKGRASYWNVVVDGRRLVAVAWSYAEPLGPMAALLDHLAFYPGRVACTVDGERVQPQPGKFYGGWITSELVGPFKGEPGTERW